MECKTIIGKSCRNCRSWLTEKYPGCCNDCWASGTKKNFEDVDEVKEK